MNINAEQKEYLKAKGWYHLDQHDKIWEKRGFTQRHFQMALITQIKLDMRDMADILKPFNIKLKGTLTPDLKKGYLS